VVYAKRTLGAVAALTIALVLNLVDMIRYAHGAWVPWNFAISWESANQRFGLSPFYCSCYSLSRANSTARL